MSDERDRLEPDASDAALPAADQPDRSMAGERPADREVVRPRVQAQPADKAPDTQPPALFEPATLRQFNARWTEIQTGFVDEPRQAVQQADALVSDVIKRIADSFGSERAELERQWDRGDDVSTEDLRQALQRYRSFFSRLLTV